MITELFNVGDDRTWLIVLRETGEIVEPVQGCADALQRKATRGRAGLLPGAPVVQRHGH